MAEGLTIFKDREYTIEDYMKLNDGNRYELIGGKLIMVPRPRLRHQEIVSGFTAEIRSFLKQNPIGKVFHEVDVYLGGKVVGPDILFIAKDRMDIANELNIQGAPDLVIEVLSPSTGRHDRKEKSKLYFNNGVKEFWIADPDEKLVEVFIAGEKDWRWGGIFDEEDVLMSTLLPGLEIKLKDVFA